MDATFFRNKQDLNWIIHETGQHLLSHPMVHLLDAQGRSIRSVKDRIMYIRKGGHSWVKIDPLDRVSLNPPPTTQRESRNCDTDLEGCIPEPTVQLKVKIGLRLERTNSMTMQRGAITFALPPSRGQQRSLKRGHVDTWPGGGHHPYGVPLGIPTGPQHGPPDPGAGQGR